MSEKILAAVSAENFIGRTRETETISRHAASETESRALLLLSAPASGASEVLRQFYDRLFERQSETIPFYFAVKESDKTARNCAVRFLHSFIAQTTAFRHRDTRILDVSPDVYELAELAAPEDGYWINRLVAACRTESHLNDDRAFIRNCLSAPLRAAAYGAKVFVMIDNLHETDLLSGEIDFTGEIIEAFSRSKLPFVLSGRRRFLSNEAQAGTANLTGAETLRIEPLDFADAGALVENLAKRYAVKISEQTRDLIAIQLGGSPAFTTFLFEAANARKIDLDNFQKVEQVYADELFGGRTGKFYDAVFQNIAPNAGARKNIIQLLFDALTSNEKKPLESWQTSLNSDDKVFNRAARLLNWNEIVRISSNRIEAMGENEVLRDYIQTRFRLEVSTENRAPVVGETMSEFIRRAPQTMAKFYRRQSSINLRDILSVFNRQDAPANLIDYSIFKNVKASENGAAAADNETIKIRLPQIVFTAHTFAFYPAISQVSEKERSIVALGFEESVYTDADEIVWLAAEIDSKLEASKETAEFWCDRLEMVALSCDFPKYKIWLVAPEGFAPEAIEVLRQRNAYGSSRQQADLLKTFLGAEKTAEKTSADEYEIIVPMGGDTELIAAGAVEEIARRHNFPAKAINQIKTALVEACINATEHSLSPDRKIYQKFAVETDKITITISNRGLRLLDKKAEEIKPEAGRRGWGLKLMKTLMDEVKIEAVDDGTRISMVKYLK